MCEDITLSSEHHGGGVTHPVKLLAFKLMYKFNTIKMNIPEERLSNLIT